MSAARKEGPQQGAGVAPWARVAWRRCGKPVRRASTQAAVPGARHHPCPHLSPQVLLPLVRHLQRRQRAQQLRRLAGAVLAQHGQLAAGGGLSRRVSGWVLRVRAVDETRGLRRGRAGAAAVQAATHGKTGKVDTAAHPSCLRTSACSSAVSAWRLAGLGPALPQPSPAPLPPPGSGAACAPRSCAASSSFWRCRRSAAACSERLASCRASTSRRAAPAASLSSSCRVP